MRIYPKFEKLLLCVDDLLENVNFRVLILFVIDIKAALHQLLALDGKPRNIALSAVQSSVVEVLRGNHFFLEHNVAKVTFLNPLK